MSASFRLITDDDFDEAEAAARGWTRSIVIELSSGARFRPLFCTPARLQHDADSAMESGAPCYPCLFAVAVAEIEIQQMETAAAYLMQWGYFDLVRAEAEPA